MAGITLESAGRLGREAFAELFSRVYSDYYLPLHADADAIDFMVQCFDLDLAESRVLHDEGAAAGFALLGVRGGRGWIGGMGVVPEFRGRGHGERVMRAVLEEARRLGLSEVGLEVLVQNAPAIGLYRRLGFATVRRLEVWSAPAAPLTEAATAGLPISRLEWREAAQWIAAQRSAPEPWQRQRESLVHFDEKSPALSATVIGLPSAPLAMGIHRLTAGRGSILQWALAPQADPAAARALLAQVAQDAATVRCLNAPEGDPVGAALAASGAALEAAQWEMKLALA